MTKQEIKEYKKIIKRIDKEKYISQFNGDYSRFGASVEEKKIYIFGFCKTKLSFNEKKFIEGAYYTGTVERVNEILDSYGVLKEPCYCSCHDET